MSQRYRTGVCLSGILLAFLNLLLIQELFAEDSPVTSPTAEASEFTNWSDRTGAFSVTAKLITQDSQTVTLETDAGKTVTVPKAKLDPERAKSIHLDWLRQQDDRQFRLTVPHAARVLKTPDAVIELLLALHQEFDTAPYAGLLAGTLLSSEANDPKKARGTLNQVISRINSHRAFDPDAHDETYQSAINNLSVCYVKLGNSNAAASLLERAYDEQSIVSLAAYHTRAA